MPNRLDIILFGASGFTGKHCIESIDNFSKLDGRNVKWGISGRSEYKLKQCLSDYQIKSGKDLSSIPIILADVNEFESLKTMTAQAKVLVNCCGPYRFYGEAVIKACIETGTHHVDVSGEPQFMETMQLNYNKAAQEKGVYIVSACGFDSIPTDLGVNFVEKKFNGTLNSVEVYLKMEDSSEHKGAFANYGTWESLIHSLLHAHELRDLRMKLFPTKLPEFLPKLVPKPSLHKFELTNTWNVPFMGADRSVVTRTQRYLYEQKKKRPVQIQMYFGFQSIFSIILLGIFERIFSFLVKRNFGRNLLLKYPRFFSYGVFSHEDSIDTTQSQKCSLLFVGQGWRGEAAPEQDSSNNPPNAKILVRLSADDPFYGLTADAVTLAALVILEENKLPERGGVYTPGAAFLNTSLMDRLQNSGRLTMEVISQT